MLQNYWVSIEFRLFTIITIRVAYRCCDRQPLRSTCYQYQKAIPRLPHSMIASIPSGFVALLYVDD
jgi:hypothetical protein